MNESGKKGVSFEPNEPPPPRSTPVDTNNWGSDNRERTVLENVWFLKFLEGWLVSENICTRKLQIKNFVDMKFPNLCYSKIVPVIHFNPTLT